MAFNTYLKLDWINLPQPDSYDLSLSDVESDSSGETEAGTIQRDIVRTGVVNISVSFSVSAEWLKILTSFSQGTKISVGYFDTQTLALKTTDMYMTDFKAKLCHDTSKKGLWSVSFNLKEY